MADLRYFRRLPRLAILRLEDGDEDAVRQSVALTESFIADMDAQMREEGFGDPSIGKQVRLLVGALANSSRLVAAHAQRRNGLGGRSPLQHLPRRPAADRNRRLPSPAEALRRFNEGLSGLDDRDVIEGRIG